MTEFIRKKYRYSFHLSPEKGWMNDPNGLTFFKGRYHIFYQYNPDNNRPGKACWGHYSSNDLVHWQSEEPALLPDKEYDQDGCYSGSAIVVNDRLYLMYTGHKNLSSGYQETQCLAYSDDGIKFYKSLVNPVIPYPPKQNTHRFRDPKIWKENGQYFAVIGGESIGHRGQVNVFKSNELSCGWHFIGELVKAKDKDGEMWECPDYFELAGNRFLLASPKGMINQGVNGFTSIWLKDVMLGQTLEEYQIHYVDEGQDFYAPQTFVDQKHNRRILIGWFGMPGLQELENEPQVGALTIPREVRLKNGSLHFPPIREIEELRLDKTVLKKKMLITDKSELDIRLLGSSFLLLIKDLEKLSFIQMIYDNDELSVSFCDKFRDFSKVIKIEKITDIRIFIDQGLTEIFINDGEKTFSNKCELHDQLGVTLEGEFSGDVYRLRGKFC